MLTIEKILLNFPRVYISDKELSIFLNKSKNSRYSKVKRLLAKGQLTQIRRGLYGITKELKPNATRSLYELAQFIYGPSYISLESALSYHGLIPEAVFTVTSVTSKRSKDFSTPEGVFSYQHLPIENFYLDVELINAPTKFLLANPWKALCDYVYCYKKNWRGINPLIKSLRIDTENLPILTEERIRNLDEYYHQQRIHHFLNGVKKDLT